MVAQWLGWTLISNKVSLYSQHIKRTKNIIADSLSRDFNISSQYFTKKFNSILPPQTSASFHIKRQTQRDYLMGIVTIIILDTTKVIAKAITTNKSDNWERWCTFLTHTGITIKFLDGIPQGEKTILVSSFAESVQRNQFGATHKPKLLRRTVKSAVSDVSTSFRTHLWVDLTLGASGKSPLSLQRQLQGYKYVDLPTKHQKAIPAKLVLHI